MTASIEIQFQNATATANTVAISVMNGIFQLESNAYLTMNGTFSFDALMISTGSLSISNWSTGDVLNGQIDIPVNSQSGMPSITVSNFSGTVTINWPTTVGPQFQQLMPGDPITLTDFVG